MSKLILAMALAFCFAQPAQASWLGPQPGEDFVIVAVHTSGFIGSPTVPSNRNDERSKEFGMSSPNFINILSAVGVV